MWAVSGKFVSAMRISGERGLKGLAEASGRNFGVASLQAGLAGSDIATNLFRSQARPGVCR